MRIINSIFHKLKASQVLAISTSCLALSLVSPLAFAQNSEFNLTINGKKVPSQQMELLFKENQRQETDPAKLRKLVRDSVIRREVLAQQATKEKLDQNSAVKTQIEMITRNALAAAYMDSKLKNAVSDSAAKKEYNRAIKEISGRKEYLTKHILVESEMAAKKIAITLKSNPKKFEDVAKKQSKDPGSAPRGGELGWVTAGTMVPEFEKAMISTKAGTISAPVKSQFGYHIVKVEKIRPIQPPKFEDIKGKIIEQLTRKKAEEIITELLSKAKIK